MKKFVLLFIGGEPKPEDQESHMNEWGDWIKDLATKGMYENGLPFVAGGKKIIGPANTVEDLDAGPGNLAGYCVIKVDSMEEAVEIAKGAPHQKNGGKTKVREAMDMPDM